MWPCNWYTVTKFAWRALKLLLSKQSQWMELFSFRNKLVSLWTSSFHFLLLMIFTVFTLYKLVSLWTSSKCKVSLVSDPLDFAIKGFVTCCFKLEQGRDLESIPTLNNFDTGFRLTVCYVLLILVKNYPTRWTTAVPQDSWWSHPYLLKIWFILIELST